MIVPKAARGTALFARGRATRFMAMAPIRELRPSGMHSKRAAAEVRAWRARLNVPQRELAELLGISQPQVSQRLLGNVPFSIDELGTIADAWGLDLGGLLRPPGQPPEHERAAAHRPHPGRTRSKTPTWKFGDRLRLIRRDMQKSQAEMAALLGVGPKSYGAWESGTNTPSDVDALAQRLEEATGISSDWWLGRGDGHELGQETALTRRNVAAEFRCAPPRAHRSGPRGGLRPHTPARGASGRASAA